MTWSEFSKKINGNYREKSNGFLVGDSIVLEIIKEEKNGILLFEKKTRRAYGASSHFNAEKLKVEFSFLNGNFGKTKIRIQKKADYNGYFKYPALNIKLMDIFRN